LRLGSARLAPEGRPLVLEGKLRDLPPGHYAVELAIPDLASRLTENGQPLRTTFTIVPPRSEEMLRLEANLPLLEDLAVASAGRVFRPEEVPQLHELLTARQRPEVERVPAEAISLVGDCARPSSGFYL
jgi:hypothetical protein